MKSTLARAFSCLSLVLLLLLPSALLAQGGPQGPQFGADPALNLLFKEAKAFTGQVQIEMVRKDWKLTMELSLDWLEGAVRTEADLTKMSSPDMSEAALEQMMSMGFTPLVSISKPNAEKVHMVYPSLKAYAEELLPKIPKLAEAKVQVTELGADEVAGHACAKRKVVVLLGQGKSREYQVWAAKDLADFPVRIQYRDRSELITITFSKVVMKAPAASRFELPAGYTAYPNVRALMQGEMMRSMDDL